MIVIGCFINSDQDFETQMLCHYGLNFMCILEEICAVANAVRHNFI